MPLQVIVRYWPNCNSGFGHLACEIIDLNPGSQQKFYISWAMHNNSASDLSVLGKDYVEIAMPLVDKDFTQALTQLKKTCYLMPDKELYGKEYSALTKNCAHSLRDILFIVGYSQAKPESSLALKPATVVKEICVYTLARLKQDRKRILAAGISYSDQIEALIENSITRLQIEKKYQSATYFPLEYQIVDDIAKLQALRESLNPRFSFDVGHVKSMVHTLTHLYFLKSISELNECLALVPKSLRYYTKVELMLDQVVEEIRLISKHAQSDEVKKAGQLAQDFYQIKVKYFQQHALSKEEFQNQCGLLFQDMNFPKNPRLQKYFIRLKAVACRDSSLMTQKMSVFYGATAGANQIFFEKSRKNQANSTELKTSSSLMNAKRV